MNTAITTAARPSAPATIETHLDGLLEPARMLKSWWRRVEGSRHVTDCPPPRVGVFTERRKFYGKEFVESLTRELAAFPNASELAQFEEAFDRAIQEPVDEATARLLVGVMLDGFRAKATDTTTVYVGALVSLLVDPFDGPRVSGPVLAFAVRRLWRSSKFTPSPAELLEVIEKVRNEFVAGRYLARKLADYRRDGEAVLAVVAEERRS